MATAAEKLKFDQGAMVNSLVSEIVRISDDFDKKVLVSMTTNGPVMYNNKDNHFQARSRRIYLLTLLVGKEQTQQLLIEHCDLTENWMNKHFNTFYVVGRKLVLGE